MIASLSSTEHNEKKCFLIFWLVFLFEVLPAVSLGKKGRGDKNTYF